MCRDVFEVLDPGPMSTIQDSGRLGYRKYGIPVSGALDAFSSIMANRLVGNDDGAPTLEMTFYGPRIKIISDCVIALTGAQMALRVNGEVRPAWASVQLRKNDVLKVGQATRGIRGYLAVMGGICAEPVMDSASTFVAANIGGYNGRAIMTGDVLRSRATERLFQRLVLAEKFRPALESRVKLRAAPGPQDDFFTEDGAAFFSTEYVCGARSDRMGIRLQGQKMEFRNPDRMTIVSEPVLAGCVQTPPDGMPIILLVEQTMGGYAKIATVITPDLDLVAQVKPGDAVSFQKIAIADAHVAHRLHKARLRSIHPSFL